MSEWFHHFAHFFLRIIVNWYTFLGTSPGGIGAQIAKLILTEAKGGWWRLSSWQNNWVGGLKRGFYSLLAVWVVVFLVCIMTTVYHDHQALVSANTILKKRVAEKQAENTKRPEKDAIRSDNEFGAISNVLGSFSFLMPSLPEADNPCRIKITAPHETIESAKLVASLAGWRGCYVIGPANLDLDPDLSLEATRGIVHDAVIVHASKDNQKAAGFVNNLGNVVHVIRRYDLPKGSRPDLIWLQFGAGSIWRQEWIKQQ